MVKSPSNNLLFVQEISAKSGPSFIAPFYSNWNETWMFNYPRSGHHLLANIDIPSCSAVCFTFPKVITHVYKPFHCLFKFVKFRHFPGTQIFLDICMYVWCTYLNLMHFVMSKCRLIRMNLMTYLRSVNTSIIGVF